MQIQSIPSFKGNPVRIGELVQKRIQELRYIRGLADLLGQTPEDYIKLQDSLMRKTPVISPKEFITKERINAALADIFGQTDKDCFILKQKLLEKAAANEKKVANNLSNSIEQGIETLF